MAMNLGSPTQYLGALDSRTTVSVERCNVSLGDSCQICQFLSAAGIQAIDTDLTAIPHGSVELKQKQTHLAQF